MPRSEVEAIADAVVALIGAGIVTDAPVARIVDVLGISEPDVAEAARRYKASGGRHPQPSRIVLREPAAPCPEPDPCPECPDCVPCPEPVAAPGDSPVYTTYSMMAGVTVTVPPHSDLAPLLCVVCHSPIGESRAAGDVQLRHAVCAPHAPQPPVPPRLRSGRRTRRG